MDFKNMSIKNEEEVPESTSYGKYNYSSLIKAAKELTPGKVLTIPLKKYHQRTNIQNALSREVKSKKFRVTGRKIDGEWHAIVKLAQGHK